MPDRYPFEEPLVQGRLVRRYKRFLADVVLDDGREVTIHCPNSGSMMGMDAPGSPVAVRHVPDPRRKLPWTWELVSADGVTWVGCNTQRPNRVAQWAIMTGQVPSLPPPTAIRREVAYGTGSRVDLVLDDEEGPVHVEIKNTTLADGPRARFPDAVTARGAKHMRELQQVVEGGGRAAILFFVNRADCDRFEVAADIDPAYDQALRSAVDAGVRPVALGMHVDPVGWTVRGELPVDLDSA